MIRINGIDFTYPQNSKKVFQDLSLEIKKGSFTALLGPNGSGKSTLIELIDGFLSPDKGDISIGDLSVNEKNIDNVRRITGITFQNPDNQIVGTSVERDIVFGPENLGLDKEDIKRRLEKVLAATGLEPLRNSEPHDLSEGQKQVLALASVMAMEPQYILLDEPSAMLDPVSRDKALEIVLEMNRGGATVLMATHSLDLALRADETVIINKGKIKSVFENLEVSKHLRTLEENDVSLPYWAEVAKELEGIGLRPFNDFKSFGEALCLKLKT